MLYRLKHHLKTGRLKAVARGVYAVVPPDGRGQARRRSGHGRRRTPAGRSLLHHTALELLGAAHSVGSNAPSTPPRSVVLSSSAVSP